MSANTDAIGNATRFYQSMNANYQSVAINTTGFHSGRNDSKSIYHYPDTMQ